MSDRSMTKLMLTGMTDKTAEELLPLAKSWYNAPEINGPENLEANYDPSQRAYVLAVEGDSRNIEFRIAATQKSPAVNPAFVIRNWGAYDVALTVNGEEISRGKNFRVGTIHTLDSSDLVVWIQYESTESFQIRFVAE